MCAGRSTRTIYKTVDQIDPHSVVESRHWKFHSHFDSAKFNFKINTNNNTDCSLRNVRKN